MARWALAVRQGIRLKTDGYTAEAGQKRNWC
jgi:hypothetical protein